VIPLDSQVYKTLHTNKQNFTTSRIVKAIHNHFTGTLAGQQHTRGSAPPTNITSHPHLLLHPTSLTSGCPGEESGANGKFSSLPPRESLEYYKWYIYTCRWKIRLYHWR